MAGAVFFAISMLQTRRGENQSGTLVAVHFLVIETLYNLKNRIRIDLNNIFHFSYSDVFRKDVFTNRHNDRSPIF
jgi:hypothetical protein